MVRGRPGVSGMTEPLIWFLGAAGQNRTEGHQTTHSWRKERGEGECEERREENGKEKGKERKMRKSGKWKREIRGCKGEKSLISVLS